MTTSDLLQENPPRRGVPATATRFARPHRWRLVVAVLLGALASLGVTLGPLVVGRMTDALLQRNRDGVLWWGGAGLALALVTPLLAAVSRQRLAAAGEYVIRDVRDAMAHGLMAAPLRFIERHRRGELVQRSTAEVAALSTFVRESLTELFTTAANVVFFVVLLGTQSWVLLLVLLVTFVPGSLLVVHRFRRRAAQVFGAEAQAEADVASDLAEAIRLRSVLRSAPTLTRRRLGGRSQELNDRAVEAQLATVVLSRWVGATTLVEGLSLAVLLSGGAWLVADGSITAGVVVTFVLASITLFSSFADLVTLVGSLEEALTGAARVHQFLEHTASGVGRSGAATPDADAADALAVEVERVWFTYADEPVVRDLSLRIERRERLGLAGPSGSGKSTLAMLVGGLYEPDLGTVRCCGLDLAAVPSSARGALVALVPQEVQLGSTSLADELRLVDPAADDARLRAAFEELGLGSWLDSLPQGLHTQLGDDSPLSAGERQLVGLVRVALRDCPVIILDEATSDLDPQVAALVERAVDELARDRTLIVVAHRQQTLERMDRVIELRDGRIVSDSSTRGADTL